jgi:hypothetical protein
MADEVRAVEPERKIERGVHWVAGFLKTGRFELVL